MKLDHDLIFGHKVKINPEGIIILVEKKPSKKEAREMTNFICAYLIDEGFFDATDTIRVEILGVK